METKNTGSMTAKDTNPEGKGSTEACEVTSESRPLPPDSAFETFFVFSRDVKAEVLWMIEHNESLHTATRVVKQGVYIQLRADGLLYVGRSDDVHRRQLEHAANGVEIVALSVIRMPPSGIGNLDAKETELIRRARETGVPLANDAKIRIVEKEIIRRATVGILDADFEAESVEAWLAAAFAPDGFLARRKEAFEGASDAALTAYARFRSHPLAAEVINLVNIYVRFCIMNPAAWFGKRWRVQIHGDGSAACPWVTLWCGSCRGFEVGVIHDQYGESLQVRVRLSETVLIAGFGSVDAALEAFPCRMWLRTAADEKSTMQKTVTAALRQAEGELSPEAATLGLSRFWSETDDTGLMAQGTPFEIEALLMTETSLLAAQLQALHDMRCTQLAGKMDPSVWLV